MPSIQYYSQLSHSICMEMRCKREQTNHCMYKGETLHEKIGIQELSGTFFSFKISFLVPILCYILSYQLRKIILYIHNLPSFFLILVVTWSKMCVFFSRSAIATLFGITFKKSMACVHVSIFTGACVSVFVLPRSSISLVFCSLELQCLLDN